jgi:prophage tail gpP-like protein
MTDIQTKFKEAQASITSVETEARAIESELNTIPGVKGRLPNRQYGTAVNTAALAQNMTVKALINRHRPDIAAYLGLQDGSDVRQEEEREAQKLRAEALRMQTERLAAQNQQARQDREARQNLAPWQRGYRSF